MKMMFLPDGLNERFGIKPHPGYAGAFTTQQAPDALPNGTRVKKTNSEPGDTNEDGATGAVLGSVYADPVGVGYFIEWDDMPKTAVFAVAKKVKPMMTQ